MRMSYASIHHGQKIQGKVIRGYQKGRSIGFPTANIDFFADWLETGVYGVKVSFQNRTYNAVMNIGTRPTFHRDEPKNIEIHILNFFEDIYGEMIESEILFKIRDEQKFDCIDGLISQIKEDVTFAIQKFKWISDMEKIV
jgi:riboflavin kinase/FMN adenylyltransferase